MHDEFNKSKILIISALIAAVFMTSCGVLPSVNSSSITIEEETITLQTEKITANTDRTAIPGKISFKPMGALSLPGQTIVTDIWSDGEIVYILGSSEGIAVIDVKDKNNPEIINTIQTDGFPNSIFVNEDFIFIASENSRFEILDKSDKYNPVLVSSIETIAAVTDIFVSGNNAFLSVADKGIQIFNIYDKKNPEIISSLALEGITYSIYQNDNYLYACAYSGGVYKINISNISNPEVDSIFKEITHPSDIYVDNDYALIANNYPDELAGQNGTKNPAGLYLIDLKDKKSLVEVSKFYTQISKFYLYKNIAFIACLEDGVKAVNVESIKNADEDKILLAEAKVDGSVYSVYAYGDYLYVLSNIFEPAVSEKETETLSKAAMFIFKIIPAETGN